MAELGIKTIILHREIARRDARVAEEARLESVYTSKAYPGFESPSLRKEYLKGPVIRPFSLFLTIYSLYILYKFFIYSL